MSRKKNYDELPPRDPPLKYGMADPGKWVDPQRIEDMQARIFCGAARPAAVPETVPA
jgi:hypothetical protein